MVMIIGLVTMTALVWVLASSLARESDAEKRRVVNGLSEYKPSSITLTEFREPLKKAA